jgi:putative spermidine/putrescine transport system ATP-binding protein
MTGNGTTPVGHLRLEGVAKSFGDVAAVKRVDLDIQPGEFVTLLGPSGSGKTTTLRMVAGFTKPSGGRIFLDGRDITAAAPNKRDVGMVFQNYALFPHMTAWKNIAFPLEMRKVPRAEIARRVDDALALVRLESVGHRYPRELSGGQQQRIALARVIVFRPSVLLMDEPLGALDRKLREALQLEIVRISRMVGTTTLYVTHDQDEALVMSDRIAIFERGQIVQIGTAEDLYERPQSVFVADFVGDSNILQGTVSRRGSTAELNVGPWRCDLPDDALTRAGVGEGQRAALIVRPERLRIVEADAAVTNGTVRLHGVVEEAVYLGSSWKYVVATSACRMVVRELVDRPQQQVRLGNSVAMEFPMEHATLLRDRQHDDMQREAPDGELG